MSYGDAYDMNSRFSDACLAGNLNEVKYFVKQGVDIRGGKDDMQFYFAKTFMQPHIVKYLNLVEKMRALKV